MMTMMMDNSATSPNCFSELQQGMEDPTNFLISNDDKCDVMEFLDEDICAVLGQDYFQISSFSPNDYSFSPNLDPNSTLYPSSSSTPTDIHDQSPPFMLNDDIDEIMNRRPAKQLKSTSNNNQNNQNPSTIHDSFDAQMSTPYLLTFGNPNSPEIINPPHHQQHHQPNATLNLNPSDEDVQVSEVFNSQSSSYGNLIEEEAAAPKSSKPTSKKSGGRVRPASQTYDHIIAERKRREILSQRFMALSTLVPGLKKMDKTSVLGDAIKYLKYLQERVQILEDQAAKQTMESVVMVKKSHVFIQEEEDDEEGSSDDQITSDGGSSEEHPLPEIEVKVCNKTLLLRIHCEKQKGVLIKLLNEIERLNLGVTNINVAPFGSLALDITIIAEMEKEYNMTTVQVIKNLRSVLLNSPPMAD
uniref:BHLH iridoid synthesis 2 n=1 Tax=Catharanthus roseus TaxID=4058 RepID=A0A0M3LQV6_CATRO|nr:bHLH iridoid synthesis 2 [Catharanthus roseus]